MITHFIGEREVAAYADDLALRLSKRMQCFPYLWFALGTSGKNFAEMLLLRMPLSLRQKVLVIRVIANRDTGHIKFLDTIPNINKIRPVLLIDSAVHSGQTMNNTAQKISARKFINLITYTLVLKRGASIIPNYFGVLIEENDRCLFELPTIPNNRLCENTPFGVLRQLEPRDAQQPFIKTGIKSIDSTTFDSLLYEQETQGSNIFVYEHNNKICGVLSFVQKGKSILIDLVANSKPYRGKGIGAALMRWAETWARSTNCRVIELWGVSSAVEFYKKRKFKLLDRKISIGSDNYFLMRRKLLYNQSFVDLTDS